MKTTIEDIAQRGGVSTATVSRVLNNSPAGVGADTRKRILAIIAETGYHPSGFARSLATGKSRSIGLIIPDISDPFFPLLVRGIEDTLNRADYSLFLCNSDHDIAKEKNYVRILMEKGVDGVILDSAESGCDCQLELLEKRNVPVVLLDRILEVPRTRPGVFVDNGEGARLATSFLLARPESTLLFLNGPADFSLAKLRLAGVEKTIRDKKLPARVLTVRNGDLSVESGYRLVLDIIDSRKTEGASGPFSHSSIFACNDLMAIGAMRALKERGIRIPQDVEVIGFDDIDLASLVDPALSTIAQPAHEMGKRSAALLLDLIDGKKLHKKTVQLLPRIVLRGTTRTLKEL